MYIVKNKERSMLYLFRKINQTIMINDDIQIQIMGVEEDNFLIGIKAPRHVVVHRQEVYERNKSITERIRLVVNKSVPLNGE